VSFATITLRVAYQRVFIVVVYFVITQSGNFWIHPHTTKILTLCLNGTTLRTGCLMGLKFPNWAAYSQQSTLWENRRNQNLKTVN